MALSEGRQRVLALWLAGFDDHASMAQWVIDMLGKSQGDQARELIRIAAELRDEYDTRIVELGERRQRLRQERDEIAAEE